MVQDKEAFNSDPTRPDRGEAQDRVEPVMIRAYHEGCKGATAFFRNRPFLDEFVKLLSSVCEQECHVLVHAASVGAEPYSLALWWLHQPNARPVKLIIHATDINPAFLEVARHGVYPPEILDGLRPEERAWFEIGKDGVRIPQQAMDMVTFLPAMSFVDGAPGASYDAVLVMNALTYVSPEQQASAIRNISNYARHVLALTAFHPDSIRRDLQGIGFHPHRARLEEIHSAWGDRLSDRPIDPASAEYSWRLPPFDAGMPDYEYRFCALFIRPPQAGQLQPELQNAVNELIQFAIGRHQSGDLAGAEALYGKAIELVPSHPVALHNLGLIYLGRGDLSAAALLLDEAVRQNPAEAAFNYNYALALQQQGDLPGALQYYARALKIRPTYREAWENQGVVFQDLERFDETIESYKQALKLDPDSRVANRNLGNALRVVGRLDDALDHYRRVIDRSPMDAEIVFGYGATLITKGDFAHGWPLYEWRFWSPDFLERNPPYRVPLPHWDGSDPEGKSLLVYGEQGIGDEIMFASCLNDLARQTGKLTLLCQPRLVPLFARSFENIEVAARVGDHPSPDWADVWPADYCVALGSLPGRLRLTEQSFPATPYLLADRSAVAAWKGRLAELGSGLKIGISWRGGAENRARQARSISLERFAPLFCRRDVTFINVQYGNHGDEIETFNRAAASPLVCFPDVAPLIDMDGFAALLSALDMVITVDNSTVHLAGALGVPAWLLLPAHADWRWLKGRERTPWYSSVQIFWQKELVSAAWQEVITRLDTALGGAQGGVCATVLPAASGCVVQTSPRPEQGRPVALLLNDTSYWYHWGCTATTLALHDGLRANGFRVDSVAITSFNRFTPLPRSLADFDDEDFFRKAGEANPELVEQIAHCDAVVINGEGRLHGLGHAALALLYTAYFAKHWMKKNTRIVNHSCYPGDPDTPGQDLADRIYSKVYGALDYVAVREGSSARELARIGIQAAKSFDCLPLYVARHVPMPVFDPASKRVVMAGSAALSSSLGDTMAKIAESVIGLGYELQVLVGANAYPAADDVQFMNTLHPRLKGRYTLVDAHSEAAWLKTIEGAALLISGRFHHSIAAAFLRTPLAVASSNTRKIEGLLECLELSPDNVWLNVDKPLQAIDNVRRLLKNPQIGLVGEKTLARLRQQATLNFSDLPIVVHSAAL